jgi:general secretion pathway protein D
VIARATLALLVLLGLTEAVWAQEVRASGDSVTLRFVDADLRAVVQSLAPYLTKPLIAPSVPTTRVSLETPAPVPRSVVASMLRGLLASQRFVLREDSTYFIVEAMTAEPTPAVAAPQTGQVVLNVIRMRHARAADVAATVNLLFGGTGAFSGASGLSGGGMLSDELRRDRVPPGLAAIMPPPTMPGQQAASLIGSVTLVPEPLTNSLLVRASQPDFEVIKAAVEQIDIRPLQVLIEVLIVEARRDKSFSLGSDIFVPQQPIGDDGSVGGTLQGGGLGDLVIRILRLGKGNIDAIIRTAASKGQVDIISRPVLIASNNVEARFLVGSQRPFVQVSRVQPTDQATRDQVVQYRDVGTKLMVRPTINQEGYVSLLIQQEISNATGETQFDAPVISTREAATQVLVRDGQTIVLGGMSDKQSDRQQGGIPILSSIPILGGLFGRASRRSTTTELYLFLTPRIIRTDADADSLTTPLLPLTERKATAAAAPVLTESGTSGVTEP